MFNVIIVDTDILIDAGRNIQQALNCLTQYEDKSKLAISIITKMELVVGCRDKNEQYGEIYQSFSTTQS